ncbi:HGL307Wp [Eremothecium sinecaudum]|uniref:chitinase n=1 Tax=Eremothecium sinecaudum TaxID=45286 RepID=A0A109UZX9_9SACH|nr:HGL307Wp [Eremothecium sinecaudum]AMD22033.1 HGL307Wp [Eremothecium sinecaudum]
MRRFSAFTYSIWISVLLVGILLEMTLLPKFITDKIEKHRKCKIENMVVNTRAIPDELCEDGKHSVAVYYSNWSVYEPRLHFPHDVDFDKLTHVYYAFFIVDEKTGKVKSSDEWADFQIELKHPTFKTAVPGALGELNHFKTTGGKDFKLIMSIGGWTNRDAFPKMVRCEKKLQEFVNTSISAMFEYGFDGIDLDWEFPKDDGYEPGMYLEMCARLRTRMDELEDQIWGPDNVHHPRFHLSMATPAFGKSLHPLQVTEMNKYISTWNMMTYDFHGSWSDRTGYHSNLYNSENSPNKSLHKRRFENMGIEGDDGLNAHDAITSMIEKFHISPRKLSLGMAAYGRGFTNVDGTEEDHLGKTYKGNGGASEGEPGIWQYNQLPIENSQEKFDDVWVSAYCFDPKIKTFVGYDNVQSMVSKREYVKAHNLGGGFWWESCGDDHKNPKRNLLNAFSEDIELGKEGSVYNDPALVDYYLKTLPKGFLVPLMNEIKKNTSH